MNDKAIALAQPLSMTMSWTELKEYAEIVARSGLVPKHLATAEKLLATMVVARDLHLPASVVLRGMLYVVNGAVSCNSQLMMALLLRSGQVKIRISKGHDADGPWVEVTMSRPSVGLEYTARWDEKRVKESHANLSPSGQEKAAWRFYRQTMIIWRAVAEAARVVAPDIIGGLYLPDELGVPTAVEGDNAILDLDTEIIDVTSSASPSAPPTQQPRPAWQMPDGRHWIEHDEIRRRFWTWTTGQLLISRDDVHEALGVESVKDFEGSMQEAKERILAWIDAKIEAENAEPVPAEIGIAEEASDEVL